MSTPSASEHARVFTYFEASGIPARSCYQYAPVYPCHVGGRRAVIKRARRTAEGAETISQWTRQLAAQNVPVVSPIPLDLPNPALVEGQNWVAYPFVDGDVYTGTPQQITQAGELLGMLHSAQTATTPPAFSWPDPDEESIVEDEAGLAQVLEPHSPQHARRLSELVRRFPKTILPQVRDAGLPESAIITDYKANNLVYAVDGPVLIDPDNADFGPRLFDLAFAALQFHTEHSPAPARTFIAEEWEAFASGYLRHVELTTQERQLWPTVVDYALSEESVWTLIDSDDWDDAREREFLLDLAAAGPERFELPRNG